MLQAQAGEVSLHSKVGAWWRAVANNDGGVADGAALIAKYYDCASEISLNSSLGAWMRQITFAIDAGGGVPLTGELNAATGELGIGQQLAFDRRASLISE